MLRVRKYGRVATKCPVAERVSWILGAIANAGNVPMIRKNSCPLGNDVAVVVDIARRSVREAWE